MVLHKKMREHKEQIIKPNSAELLAQFLEKTNLHKRDFAQMIGVTLSYVYNLIDEAIPFSSRSTTLERIATVMDIEPETFKEYKIPQEPLMMDEGVEFLKEILKEKKIPTYQFLKSFPRKKRVEIVDVLRGAMPMPADWKELESIGNVLGKSKQEIYPYWENRIRQIFSNSGMNLQANASLINSMFNCARNYIDN